MFETFDLTRDQNAVNEKVMLVCPLCPYESNRKSNFDRHMKSMHEEIEDDPFHCCGQIFTSKAKLKSHCKEFHKNGYRCDEKECNKVFPRKALLRRHQTVHNGIKEFRCPNCNYETSHKSNLERHCLRLHRLILHKSGQRLKYKKRKNNFTVTRLRPSSALSENYSEPEFTSSQEFFSSQETKPFTSSVDSVDYRFIEYKPNQMGGNEDILGQIHNFQEMKISGNSFGDKCDNKKLRLCLKPYKCLICWLLFESQLEYFEHQLLTDHMIEDSEQKERLEVIQAAAVLTQFRRSGAKR